MTLKLNRREFAGSMIGGAAGLATLAIAGTAAAQTQAKTQTKTQAKTGGEQPMPSQKGEKTMPKTALLLIDIQNDYFPGGKFTLPGMTEAAGKAAQLLAEFRTKGLPVIHVRHEDLSKDAPFFMAGTKGAEINSAVTPKAGEPIIVKHFPNSFLKTNLKETLDAAGIKALVVVGAMSNMCVDGSTRAASDLGYQCTVAQDACAAMPIEFNGVKVPAPEVHAAFMGALGMAYAKVINTGEVMTSL